MRLSRMIGLIVMFFLAILLSACSSKSQPKPVQAQPSSTASATPRGVTEERAPVNIKVSIVNDGDDRVLIPKQVRHVEFNREKLFEQWPYEAFEQNSTFEIHVIASDPYTVVIWPFRLNGQDMPAKKDHIWVGVVSTDVTVITLNGHLYAPSFTCESTTEDGPNLYMIELEATLLRQFQEELKPLDDDKQRG